MKCYRENLVGVFGDPVDENPTGAILQAGFDAMKLNYRFITVKVSDGCLEDAIRGMRAMNFSGIGITMPHKQTVLKYLDEVSPDAAIMGAVNTVYWKKGKLYGENVDGKGFMMSLKEKNFDVAGKKAVVLGAGGASRAISVELALAGVRAITIVNIEEKQGMSLVDAINTSTSAKADFVLWNGSYALPDDTEILVNATSVGFSNEKDMPNIDYGTLKDTMTVCDVIPNRVTTRFLESAKEKGCLTFNGLGMLVNQATLCFKLWTGENAPKDVMEKALKKEFGIEE